MTLKLPATVSLSATLVGGIATFAFALLGGWLGDRFGRRALVLWPRVALVVLIWPLFLWMAAAPSATTLWIATALTTGLTALSAGIGLAILPELLPNRARATGFAVSYAIGVSHLRRLDAVRHRLADQGDRQPGRAGLVCHGDQPRHHRRVVLPAGDARPQDRLGHAAFKGALGTRSQIALFARNAIWRSRPQGSEPIHMKCSML